MAIESISIPLGSKIPFFKLPGPTGKEYSSSDLPGNEGLLVVFTCNHCPYALAIWPRLIELAKEILPMGINTVGINPNINPKYPDDAPDKMIEKIREWNIPFPYLVDESQHIAQAFKAQCTPDIYLYNNQSELVYHGRLDDNWKEPEKVTRHELKNAITNLLDGKPPLKDQFPSMGCSIKWREVG